MNRNKIAAMDNIITGYIRLVDMGDYEASKQEVIYWLEQYTKDIIDIDKPLVQILEILLETISKREQESFAS